MAATKKKAIALLTTAVGLGIVLVAGIVLYRPLEERYWLWKLREGDEGEKERAADRLAELGVEEAVPILIDFIPDDPDPPLHPRDNLAARQTTSSTKLTRHRSATRPACA